MKTLSVNQSRLEYADMEWPHTTRKMLKIFTEQSTDKYGAKLETHDI